MITEEQLNKVDQFLASAKLTDDYILEFKDHVLCDIEIEMDAGLSFENAFEIVKEKWVAFLRPKATFFLGLTNMFPAIMIKKLKRESLKNLAFSAMITVCLIIPYFIYRKEMTESMNIIFRSIVLCIAIASSIYFTFKFRFKKERYFSTIHSNLLKINSYGPFTFCLVSILLFGLFSNIDRLNEISSSSLFYSAFIITGDTRKVDVSFLSFYIFLAVSNFRLYFLHQRISKTLTTAY